MVWSRHCIIERRQMGEKSVPCTVMEPFCFLHGLGIWRGTGFLATFTFLDALWLQLWLVTGVNKSLQRFAIFRGHQLLCSCFSPPQSPPKPFPLPPPPWHTKQRHTSFRSLAVNRSRLIFCFSLVCIGVKMSWSQLFIQIAAMHIFTRQIKSTSCLVFNILSWSKSWALMIEEEVETNYKNIYRRTTVISEFLLIFFSGRKYSCSQCANARFRL